jgi:2-methylcitrate dehydratase
MDDIIAAIADHAARFELGAAPADVVHAAKRHLVDGIACGLGGYDCAAASIGRRIAASAAPPARAARSLGGQAPVAAEAAAFITTAMIRYLDFNDTVHGGHPSDALGAVLAAADMTRSDGARLIAGMIVAYETAARIIAAARLRERGWDQGFAIGIAAAAGAGHVLRLPAAEIAHAVSIAAVGCLPPRVTRSGELSMWKGAATAFATRNAMFAALLASEGMTAPEAAFTGRHGVFEQTGGPFSPRPFGDHMIGAIGLKYWPVENGAQAAVWAALELREKAATAEIAAIDIRTATPIWHEIGSEPAKWDPKTRETADHSMPYIFARALVDGAITVRSFDERQYLDPGLRSLMAKITVAKDDAIDAVYPGRVILRVRAARASGETIAIEIVNPRGHARNRMDDGEISAKFLGLAEPALGRARAANALEGLWRVEREPSVPALMDALAIAA